MDAGTRFCRAAAYCLPLTAAATALFLLLECVAVWTATCGTSASSCLTLSLAFAVGAAASVHVVPQLPPIPWLPPVAAGILAGFAWSSPALFEGCFQAAVNVGGGAPWLWAAAAVAPTLAAFLSILLMQTVPESGQRRVLLGMCVAAVLFAAHTWLSVPFACTTTVLAVCVTGQWVLSERRTSFPGPKRADDTTWMRPAVLVVLSTVAGIVMTCGWLMLNRLFPITLLTGATALAIGFLLLLATLLPVFRLMEKPFRVCSIVIACVAITPWIYEELIFLNLRVNAMSPSALGILTVRGLQLAVWSVLTLLALTSGARVLSPDRRVSMLMQAPAFFAGIGMPWFFSQLSVHPAHLAAFGIMVLAALPVLFCRTVASQIWTAAARFGLAGSACVAFLSLTIGAPDLAAPSRLLFTLRSLAAVARGIEPQMIPASDAARLLESRETASGTWTLWKSMGDRVEWRINGVAVSSASLNPETSPHPPQDVLCFVLPLTVHPHPGRILLLDDVSGAGVSVCCEFPLHDIIAVRSDDQIRTIDELLSTTEADQRAPASVKRISDIPEVALRDASTGDVDVVICGLTDPVCGDAPARLTQGFYRAVADRLTVDGLLCQRIRQQRIGGTDILQTLGTAAAAFHRLAVVQLVPGELALLASNSRTPLFDRGLLKRMQLQHVRRQLAKCGWDWCQLAALPVVESADPVGLWHHSEFPAPASCGDGAATLRPGWEVIRPAPRALEIRQLFAPHERRIAEAVPPNSELEEFRRRISAYAQQVEVLTAFPDEPWTYRKSLRFEMQRNARPPLEVIRDGEIQRRSHPLDEHRKDYFVTLGRLLQQVRDGQLHAEDLQHLRDFSAEYEPLISVFAHYELVRIHELAGHPVPVDEFRHRLHTIYYTPTGDFSVRNVVAALDQLTKRPELLPEQQRFDQLNALIQVLIQRWEYRTVFEPRSAVRTQQDVDLSLHNTRRALERMEQLADDVGCSPDEFLARRRFVSQALLGPLRDYRDTVLAHRAKHEQVLLMDDEDADDDLPMLMDELATN